MIKVSIVTACYNSEKFLGDCMNSVNSQSYNNIEHIIIDGCSSDLTIKVARSLANSATIVKSECDSGIYNAMNKGAKIATGDVIGFLNSDDFFVHDLVIERIVEKFLKHECEIIYSNLNYVSRFNVEKVVRKWDAGAFGSESLKRGWMAPHPTLYMKRDLFHQLDGFNEDFKISADYDLMLRLFKNVNLKVAYLNELTVSMRTGGASNKSVKNLYDKACEDYRAIKKHNKLAIFQLISKNLVKINQFFK